MGNESLNFLKSAGKNIVSEIVNDLSETGITEALIKEGIPINRLMMVVSKEKNAVNPNMTSHNKNENKNTSKNSGKNTNKNGNKNTGKNQLSGKKKQSKQKKNPADGNQQKEQDIQDNVSASKIKNVSKAKFSAEYVTTEQLRDAVVWSEILGKPVSRKRRDRRKIYG